MARPGLPPNSSLVPFDIVEEHWGEYEVEGGEVVIRARVVAQHLFSINGGKDWGVNGMPIIVVTAERDSMRGTPNFQGVEPGQKTYPVEWNATREPWNIYRTRGPTPMLIKTRLVVTGISRVADKFDAVGEPVYVVNHNTVIGPPIPDKNAVTK